jgi:hypothetical protein
VPRRRAGRPPPGRAAPGRTRAASATSAPPRPPAAPPPAATTRARRTEASPGSGARLPPASGRTTAVPGTSPSTTDPTARVPRGQRPVQVAGHRRGQAAAHRQAAKPAMASTGSRPTHRFGGRPAMPGVSSPWPSMRKPTVKQPRASRTRLPSRLRPAATAVATATASAQAEMALTTTRWTVADRITRSRLGWVRSSSSVPWGASSASSTIAAPTGPDVAGREPCSYLPRSAARRGDLKAVRRYLLNPAVSPLRSWRRPIA